MTSRLKTDMLVAAALRIAMSELIDCVVLRRGNADAGAILVHIDRLDGGHMLLARALEFDGSYAWRPVVAGADGDGWAERDAVETPPCARTRDRPRCLCAGHSGRPRAQPV